MITPPNDGGPGTNGLQRQDVLVAPKGHRRLQSTSLIRQRGSQRRSAMIAVMAIAAFNLLFRLGDPQAPVWDESYYLTSTARYELGFASYASHPPLGLMLIAAGDRLTGRNQNVEFSLLAREKTVKAEQVPADFDYVGVRLASAAFGVAAITLFFALMLTITGSVGGAFLATSPFLFDTALLAQFRAAQLDAFQLCFTVAALLCLSLADRRRSARWLFGFGFACGLSAMVRANGLLLLAGTMLPLVRAIVSDQLFLVRVSRALRVIAATMTGAGLAIAAVFLVHLAVASRPMPNNWAAARADAAFIHPAYRAYLDGTEPASVTAFAAASTGYRDFMAADLAGIGPSDANSSSPLGWPLGRKPIV